MDLQLHPLETRILGALIEKEATTPEYYPLSLNALVNACNQKSNRDPVTDYDDDTVADGLESLRAKKLAYVIEGSRATKYSQRFSETLNLGRRELAVLCVLFLRGPQTLGEIKDRTERIFAFADLDETERVLDKMAETGFLRRLAKQPGQKEPRYAHLLSGEPLVNAAALDGVGSIPKGGRVSELENEMQSLRTEVAELKRRLDDLESQLK